MQVESYVADVRRQLAAEVRRGGLDRRALALALEHERMHCETLWWGGGGRRAPRRLAHAGRRQGLCPPGPATTPPPLPCPFPPLPNPQFSHMLAMQRRLDAEARGSAPPALVDPPPAEAAADAARPRSFYLTPACSYLAAAPEGDGSSAAAAGDEAPQAPATPERRPWAARRLLSALLGATPSPAPGPALPASPAGDLAHVPGGAVVLGLDPGLRHGFLWDIELGCSGRLAVAPLDVARGPGDLRP